MKQTTPDTPEAPPHPADETIKETFESIIIAFILAFVFRAYIVEAFVIPTGSMAPSLLGAHYRAECEQCGYDFKINYNPNKDSGSRRPWMNGAQCPMCHYNIDMARNARFRPGDRILVHKYVFSVSDPRRWDVVVFKAPHQPNTNFIKRLVGLPNESVRLLDGNVYTRARGESLWQIARKGDAPRVQRAAWQPLYHSQYIPRDGGELNGPGERRATNRWSVPWTVQQGQWDIENRRSYRYGGGGDGLIAFDFRRGGSFDLPTVYAYNQYDAASFSDEIEDIRLALTVQPDGDDTGVSLSTRTRLEGATQTVTAYVQADGSIRLTATVPGTDKETELMTGQVAPLRAGKSVPIELWAVDHELSVWIDGERELRYLFASELTDEQMAHRPAPARTPLVQIGLTGSGATLHAVELDRDLYYSGSNPNGPARGGMMRDAHGRVITSRLRPMQLNDNEYFCIGDNNPLSDDGRFWDPDPSRSSNSDNVGPDALWVRQRFFTDDITDASRDGVVPGELMMGRAFFVYFPAPYSWSTNGAGVIPNFADMRFIH